MKNKNSFFRNYEEVRIGRDVNIIEHGPLENIIWLGSAVVLAVATSPIWVPGSMYNFGKECYDKYFKKD